MNQVSATGRTALGEMRRLLGVLRGPAGPGQAGTGRAGGGHGIEGMRERAAVFGGRVSAGPRPGGGWRVHTVLRPAVTERA